MDIIKIHTAPGPEDLALDPSNDGRIIISCCRRWIGKVYDGVIQYLDRKSTDNNVKSYQINGFDKSKLRPHGICTATVNGRNLLYVISHEKRERIHVFEIGDIDLTLVETYTQDSILDLINPNDLFVDCLGNMYVTCTRSQISGYIGFKPGYILKIDQQGKYVKIINHLHFPNGIIIKDNKLYCTDTINRRLWLHEKKNDSWQEIGTTLGTPGIGDNITSWGEQLVVATHSSAGRFIIHSAFHSFRSPGHVFLYDVNSGKLNEIDGLKNEISGISVGLIANDYLYVGQVFGNFILKIHIGAIL